MSAYNLSPIVILSTLIPSTEPYYPDIHFPDFCWIPWLPELRDPENYNAQLLMKWVLDYGSIGLVP